MRAAADERGAFGGRLNRGRGLHSFEGFRASRAGGTGEALLFVWLIGYVSTAEEEIKGLGGVRALSSDRL